MNSIVWLIPFNKYPTKNTKRNNTSAVRRIPLPTPPLQQLPALSKPQESRHFPKSDHPHLHNTPTSRIKNYPTGRKSKAHRGKAASARAKNGVNTRRRRAPAYWFAIWQIDNCARWLTYIGSHAAQARISQDRARAYRLAARAIRFNDTRAPKKSRESLRSYLLRAAMAALSQARTTRKYRGGATDGMRSSAATFLSNIEVRLLA